MGAELHRRASAAASRAGVDKIRVVCGRQKVGAQDAVESPFRGRFKWNPLNSRVCRWEGAWGLWWGVGGE